MLEDPSEVKRGTDKMIFPELAIKKQNGNKYPKAPELENWCIVGSFPQEN